MDALARLLDQIRVRSTVYFSKRMPDTWGIQVPHDDMLCRFHLVLSGETWITIPDTGRQKHLSLYDFAIVPHGRMHTLSDTPDRKITDIEAIPGEVSPQKNIVEIDDKGTSLLCGYFRYSEAAPKVFMGQLPDLLVLRSKEGGGKGLKSVEAIVKMVLLEASMDRLAGELILNRCTEILSLCALREWVQNEAPFNGALSDQRISRTVAAMVESPHESWTVESLSRLAGQSRTIFAALFQSALGVGPIEFLQNYRIELARSLLVDTDMRLDAVAAQVGYRDTSAFSRAFSRSVGVSPAQYRKVSRN